jgi:hypothetical protein
VQPGGTATKTEDAVGPTSASTSTSMGDEETCKEEGVGGIGAAVDCDSLRARDSYHIWIAGTVLNTRRMNVSVLINRLKS